MSIKKPNAFGNSIIAKYRDQFIRSADINIRTYSYIIIIPLIFVGLLFLLEIIIGIGIIGRADSMGITGSSSLVFCIFASALFSFIIQIQINKRRDYREFGKMEGAPDIFTRLVKLSSNSIYIPIGLILLMNFVIGIAIWQNYTYELTYFADLWASLKPLTVINDELLAQVNVDWDAIDANAERMEMILADEFNFMSVHQLENYEKAVVSRRNNSFIMLGINLAIDQGFGALLALMIAEATSALVINHYQLASMGINQAGIGNKPGDEVPDNEDAWAKARRDFKESSSKDPNKYIEYKSILIALVKAVNKSSKLSVSTLDGLSLRTEKETEIYKHGHTLTFYYMEKLRKDVKILKSNLGLAKLTGFKEGSLKDAKAFSDDKVKEAAERVITLIKEYETHVAALGK